MNLLDRYVQRSYSYWRIPQLMELISFVLKEVSEMEKVVYDIVLPMPGSDIGFPLCVCESVDAVEAVVCSLLRPGCDGPTQIQIVKKKVAVPSPS